MAAAPIHAVPFKKSRLLFSILNTFEVVWKTVKFYQIISVSSIITFILPFVTHISEE